MPGYIPDDRAVLRQAYEDAARLMGPGWTADKLRWALGVFRDCVVELRRLRAKEQRLVAHAVERQKRKAAAKAAGGA
jgi:hypothetical protein